MLLLKAMCECLKHSSVSFIPWLKLSLHVVAEAAAQVCCELDCPRLTAGLLVNKVLIRCPSAQFVHGSFLPQGDNQPTHPGDQDGIEGQKKSNTGGKTLAMYSYTMERNCWHAIFSFFLDRYSKKGSESPRC